VVTEKDSAGQEAPAGLEPVRILLNSWLIPNDSREPADLFAGLASARGWPRREAAVVRELRDDLRPMTESGHADGAVLNDWIERLGLRPAVATAAGDGSQQIVYLHEGGPAGDILAAVVEAIGAGTWKRLKACPDCRWVFFDNTRNGSKRWCLMYAGGPDGRACGTIAKVRRYRDRWNPANSVEPARLPGRATRPAAAPVAARHSSRAAPVPPR
jgi:predicted RNA-binding Zn ribbon-like protein